jgi:hypothetical protein
MDGTAVEGIERPVSTVGNRYCFKGSSSDVETTRAASFNEDEGGMDDIGIEGVIIVRSFLRFAGGCKLPVSTLEVALTKDD